VVQGKITRFSTSSRITPCGIGAAFPIIPTFSRMERILIEEYRVVDTAIEVWNLSEEKPE
jgi:hypothetical protein